MSDKSKELEVKYPRINFRLGTHLAEALSSRQVNDSLDLTAKRDLERYYDMLQRSLPHFSMGEALLMCDVFNGTIHMPYSVSLLWASVSDSIEGGQGEYWQEHYPSLDVPALVERLRKLTPFECMAVADAIERAWNSPEYRINNMEERVVAVGLVKPPKEVR